MIFLLLGRKYVFRFNLAILHVKPKYKNFQRSKHANTKQTNYNVAKTTHVRTAEKVLALYFKGLSQMLITTRESASAINADLPAKPQIDKYLTWPSHR